MNPQAPPGARGGTPREVDRAGSPIRGRVPYATLFRTIQDLESHLRTAAIVAAGILILLVHLAFYPWPASIPDMQDLHKQFDKQRHKQKKEKEPPPNAL